MMKFSLILAASLFAGPIAHAETFANSYKILCPSNPAGCPCREGPSDSDAVVTKFTMYQRVESVSGRDELKEPSSPWIELKTKSRTCFLKRENLRAIYWLSTSCPDSADFKNLPFASPSAFLKDGKLSSERIKAGTIFPTMYNVAAEVLFPGEKTESLYEVGTDKFITKVTKDYRESMDFEGTGLLEDGRMLNVGERVNGVWKYVILPKGSFGLGIFGHYLYPFRVAAVDFQYLCEKMGRTDCEDAAAIRKKLVGTLLFFPKLVGLKLPNGATHDGYICAQDIGGVIKRDRIDLFVGPMGGGSPWTPVCQSTNTYIQQGIESLVPQDWKSWKAMPEGKFERTEPFEYRQNVPAKGLEFEIVKGSTCKGLWN
jgi:hypothetical protein